MSICGSGMQPPEGPPICTALHFLPLGMPPPTANTISRMVVPMGTSTRPVRLTMPESANTLVPLLLAVPTAAKASPPISIRAGTQAKRLDVVDDRGHAEQPLHCRERRTRTRHAALAFDTLHERGFLAAHEGAGAQLEHDFQVETAAQDVLAEQAVLGRLGNGGLQALDGQRILGANVDVRLAGADGVGRDDHAFEQAIGIALGHRAIHERARDRPRRRCR